VLPFAAVLSAAGGIVDRCALISPVAFVVACFVTNRVVAAGRLCGRIQWKEQHYHLGCRENKVMHLIFIYIYIYTYFIISFIIIISTRGCPACLYIFVPFFFTFIIIIITLVRHQPKTIIVFI
jgi:hypothetical protein